jgi:hypothetical protein
MNLLHRSAGALRTDIYANKSKEVYKEINCKSYLGAILTPVWVKSVATLFSCCHFDYFRNTN